MVETGPEAWSQVPVHCSSHHTTLYTQDAGCHLS